MFLLRSLSLLLMATLVAGCGGGQAPIKSPIKTSNRAEPAAPVVANQAPSIQAPSQPKPVAEAPKTPKPPRADFGVDLTNVFDVTDSSSRFEVVSQRGHLPTDRFSVDAGMPKASSESFVLAAASVPAGGEARPNWSLPEGFRPLSQYGNSPDGYPLRIQCAKDKSIMAFISGGPSKLGIADGPTECMPEVIVDLDPFYIDIVEVTVMQLTNLQAERKEKKQTALVFSNTKDPAHFPALGVTVSTAVAYLKPLGKELPTESEFERAARGPGGLRTPWGNGREIWSKPRSPGTITAVAEFTGDLTPEGVYDLAGNAREWTRDWYSPGAHREAQKAPRAALKNWAGPRRLANENLRVVKGNASDWSAWQREGRDEGQKHNDVGFRGVLHIVAKAAAGK